MTAYKAVTPELVDLKITNFCTRGCRYCYQDSTKEGKHAEPQNVEKIIDALALLKVFEIAVGGGEPTTHPDFVRFLKRARRLDIVPNFSTRELGWTREPDVAVEIAKEIGGFAYSVEIDNDVRALSRAITIMDYACKLKVGYDFFRVPAVSAQFILGTGCLNKSMFKQLLLTACVLQLPVTLLGFKPYGRAAQQIRHPVSFWVDAVQELQKEGNCPTIGIDTCIAACYQEQLKSMRIDPRCYQTEEGKVSCYIDAVEGYVSRSSYDPNSIDPLDLTLDVPNLAQQIKTIFARY